MKKHLVPLSLWAILSLMVACNTSKNIATTPAADKPQKATEADPNIEFSPTQKQRDAQSGGKKIQTKQGTPKAYEAAPMERIDSIWHSDSSVQNIDFQFFTIIITKIVLKLWPES